MSGIWGQLANARTNAIMCQPASIIHPSTELCTNKPWNTQAVHRYLQFQEKSWTKKNPVHSIPKKPATGKYLLLPHQSAVFGSLVYTHTIPHSLVVTEAATDPIPSLLAPVATVCWLYDHWVPETVLVNIPVIDHVQHAIYSFCKIMLILTNGFNW